MVVPGSVLCQSGWRAIMEFDLEDFFNGPTCDKLEGCTKENLKLIAERFDIIISKQRRKQVIKDQFALEEKEPELFRPTQGGSYPH